ncbi:hypothetical protein [Salinarchaeum sp. Harcht-Bsk1]|uniref:hypothetical protein n=1 Tax=Salinarchaeum sp. Harcht-Bsk1 TaxID=1333523 RepID=UPI001181829C|nr:hypothetical protein [Salinarchaeum sp. Harcht-Bsk1]
MSNELTEEDIIERIRDGLRDAVEGQNLSWEHGTQVKKQKYVDIALNHSVGSIMSKEGQQSPVTRSWYKYGCVQTASTSRAAFSPDQTPNNSIDDEEMSLGPFEPPVELLVPEEGTGVPPSKHDIASKSTIDFMQFFTQSELTPPLDAEHWAKMSNIEFLRPYYTETAPSEFRDLYLANLSLREVLGRAFETARLAERNRADLLTGSTELELDWTPDTYLQTAGQAAVELRLAIRSSPIVPDGLIDPVTTFTDLIEDVLLSLTDLELTEIRPMHYRTLKQIDEFLDATIWEWIARYISYATVVGPQATSWREGSRERFATFASTCPGQIDELRENINQRGLLPAIDGYAGASIENNSAEQFMNVIDEAAIRELELEPTSGDNYE